MPSWSSAFPGRTAIFVAHDHETDDDKDQSDQEQHDVFFHEKSAEITAVEIAPGFHRIARIRNKRFDERLDGKILKSVFELYAVIQRHGDAGSDERFRVFKGHEKVRLVDVPVPALENTRDPVAAAHLW